MAKQFLYKVYNAAGTYIKTWDDNVVASEPVFAEELNTAGAEMVLKLARPADSYGEGVDVDFNFQVKIYVVDEDQPNGLLKFHGKMANYKPIYGSDEGVEITLLSFGSDLDQQILDLGDAIRQESYNYDQDVGSTGFTEYVAQDFTPQEDVYMNSLTLRIKTTDDGGAGSEWPVAVRVVQGSPSGIAAGAGTAIAELTQQVDSLDEYSDIEFNFGEVFKLTAGTQYYLEILSASVGSSFINVYLAADSGNPYAYGHVWAIAGGGGTYSAGFQNFYAAYDLWFRIDGGTTLKIDRADPGAMARQLMAIYQDFGGAASYDNSTIELTGQSETYEFNSITYAEALDKCRELSPDGWFWRVDPGTGYVHFHFNPGSIDNKLILGKDLQILDVDKRIEGIINTVYFTGADGFYKKFVRQPSIDTYGVRAVRYVDQRVSVEATAKRLANAILDSRSAPEIRMACAVIDSNIAGGGFDIESLVVGDTVSFRNIGAADSSLWDVGFFDVGFWDFNIKQIESFVYQITRIEYGPSSAALTLANIIPSSTKRVEQINKSLLSTQTIDNPTAPS